MHQYFIKVAYYSTLNALKLKTKKKPYMFCCHGNDLCHQKLLYNSYLLVILTADTLGSHLYKNYTLDHTLSYAINY